MGGGERQRERENISGNQSVSGSLVLSVLRQSDSRVRLGVCTLPRLCVFVRVCRGNRGSLEGRTKLPITAQPESAAPRTSSRPPTIWHMSAHTPKTHIGHVSAARGPLADHKPQDRSEPADDTWCQSDWAAHTHLQRWK